MNWWKEKKTPVSNCTDTIHIFSFLFVSKRKGEAGRMKRSISSFGFI